ncbi:MAG: cell division protein FtsQ/DivIB [Holosporales bacterium]|nr:cell division protein FtsQ/DivIB [Holosporales bacterium]
MKSHNNARKTKISSQRNSHIEIEKAAENKSQAPMRARKRASQKPVAKPAKRKGKICKMASLLLALAVCFFLLYKGLFFFNRFFLEITEKMGFVISDIYLTEEGPVPGNSVSKYIKIKRNQAIFASSTLDITRDILENKWVKDVTVHKGFPNKISISVVYKMGVAIFQQNSRFTIIDENGEDIVEISKSEINPDMPTIVGAKARKQFFSFLRTLDRYPTVRRKLNSMAFIRERRWDIIVSGGIVVKLPETDVNASLSSLEIILKNPNFNVRTVKVIDMRQKERTIISGVKIAEETKSPGKKKV